MASLCLISSDDPAWTELMVQMGASLANQRIVAH
jgi:hypothetical protein